jgi:hypothetical protein
VRIVVTFILAAVCACAGDLTKTLISEDEAEPIHSAIVRKEAWTQDSVRRLRAAAEKYMKERPWTVTAQRPANADIDIHDYYSVAPYWWPNPDNPQGPYIRKDGQTNPDRFMANKTALNSMCDAVFALGSAAFFLDDAKYARRAVRVIHTWFLDTKTRMNPHLEYAQAIPGVNDGRGAGIIDGRVLIRAVQGMEFLAETGNWDLKEQAAVRRWFEEYLHWLTDSNNAEDEKRSGNNHASWWTAQVAAIASFVDNQVVQKMAFNYYRDQIFPRQIRSDGSAPREESRTRSLWYSAFNLEAFVTICRIAQVHGVELWQVRAQKDATIATVIDYLQPYLTDPHKWRREQIADFRPEGLDFLAFAGMGLKRPEYVSLFRKLERPDGAWTCVVDLVVSRWEAAKHQTRH